jgi:hypothetical protein
MFKIVHQGVSRKSKEYYDVLRRYNYVTPTSYLELLQTFKVRSTCSRVLLWWWYPSLPVSLRLDSPLL